MLQCTQTHSYLQIVLQVIAMNGQIITAGGFGAKITKELQIQLLKKLV